MKILYIISSTHYSGAEIVMERLISANRKNVEPVIILPEGDFFDYLVSKGMKCIKCNSMKALELSAGRYSSVRLAMLLVGRFSHILFLLLKTVLSERINLIHANGLTAAVYALPLCILAKISGRLKFIWSNHDLTYPNHAGLYEKLAVLCNKMYNMSIVVSSAVKNKFIQNNDLNVLYNGIDLSVHKLDLEKRSRWRREYGFRDEDTVIAVVGQIRRGKGHSLIIKAVNEINRKYFDLKLIIIGKYIPSEPGYKDELDILAKDAGNVIFLEFQKDVSSVYSGIDILLNYTLNSMRESLGTTIYEAMAYERVVFASKTGGSPEIIDDKINGFLVEPDDPEKLASALDYYLSNKEKFAELGHSARVKVENNFEISFMAENYNKLLKGIASC
jgi:glycosyltransferase involved in cell wall biosynthesis